MNNKSIATALTLGFLAFIFLAIQPTPAQAEDCPPGTKLNPMGKCTWGGGWAAPTGPNSECPPGTKPAKNIYGVWQCVPRPVKQIGKVKTQAACEAEGNRWDQQAGRCIRSTTWESKGPALKSALKAQCAAKGGRIDEQTGQCIETSGGAGGE
jgi:hypothetical protein